MQKARKTAFDRRHRQTLRFNISRYDAAVAKGKATYGNLALAKARAAYIKQLTVNNLHDCLLQFEENLTAHGGTVIWAENATEAIAAILKLLHEHNAHTVVKSKSMTTEEVDFNEHAATADIESLETDLGEYIVQLAGEKPYHIVTPAMHKSKEDIARLFHDKFGTPPDSTPETITAFVRQLLRDKFRHAEVGVTGANFLIADSGAIAVTENEGNALMTVSFPKIHIAVAGIEKVIPSLESLGLLWPLLAVHGTGQRVTAYNSIISGPRRTDGEAPEVDGPEKMYVILLDNGRSKLYGRLPQAQALRCIRCGACLNACPIYKNIGGYTYAATYSGPIGSVITPFYKGFADYGHLSFACTVCGRCSEVCPVSLPLHRLLLFNRHDAVEQGTAGRMWGMAMNAARYILGKRRRMDRIPGRLKNAAFLAGKNMLGARKSMPHFAEHSFSQMWKHQR
ncbi:MAG: lactate utilization protein [Bacteroidales bacterium]|nr:lactate utilization protein [Bacteroidales bacterium]